MARKILGVILLLLVVALGVTYFMCTSDVFGLGEHTSNTVGAFALGGAVVCMVAAMFVHPGKPGEKK